MEGKMGLFIGKIELGSIPRVVGTISDNDILTLSNETIERIDILELRIDMFKDHSPQYIEQKFKSVRTRFDKPIIATIRNVEEGGHLKISDTHKYELFEFVTPFSDAVDTEIKSGELIERVVSLCKSHNKLIIGSYHNFNETPDIGYMDDIASKAKQYGVDIVKIAVKANTKDDIARLASFTIKNKKIGLITISLGNIGLISRIFNPIIGSLITYGHLGSPSAPGQISALDIVNYLRMFDPEYNEALINRLQLLEYV